MFNKVTRKLVIGMRENKRNTDQKNIWKIKVNNILEIKSKQYANIFCFLDRVFSSDVEGLTNKMNNKFND
jgi:hypothetical protein